MSNIRLDRTFYESDATEVAKELLGKIIVRKLDNGDIVRYVITETESYMGEEDSACHAHKGKTKRNETMYEQAGLLYIYLCYGMHYMLNIVTGKKDSPQAVLIRGIEGYNGPGKLTKVLEITKELNGIDICSSDVFYIEDSKQKYEYISSPRIGIDYASEPYKSIEWRFTIKS